MLASLAEQLAKLEDLLKRPNELEWLEFKSAKEDFDFEKIGQYFSGLSNEANLHGQDAGWLLLGIDRKHNVVGTQWKRNPGALEALKHDIALHTALNHTFKQIYEVPHLKGRVLMFEIPPAPHGVPMSWRGHWYGREGESIGALNQTKLDAIRAKGIPDWTAAIVPEASIDDLDTAAVSTARDGFKKKNAHLAGECDGWSNIAFLDKAKLARSGKIPRATLLLLGKREAAHWLNPADVRITWILKDLTDADADYHHFEPPFLLNTQALYNRIKNITYRIMPSGSLFPIELLKYDAWVIREVLHNCIAHQDYAMQGRINVVEREDSLTFSNLGAFIPQSVDRVLESGFTPDRYRNPFLADAMVQINMIDTIGSGIRRMFRKQRERGFPLPDYDLSNTNKVVTSIHGKVLDENYTRALLSEPDLNLDDVVALDKVQKRKALTEAEVKSLKQKRLIGGRRPNFYVSARVAAATGGQVEHVLVSGVEDSHYKELVLTLIRRFGSASPEQINKMLLPKLPSILDEQQRKDKIRNLLQEMSKKDASIRNIGKRGRGATWALAD